LANSASTSPSPSLSLPFEHHAALVFGYRLEYLNLKHYRAGGGVGIKAHREGAQAALSLISSAI